MVWFEAKISAPRNNLGNDCTYLKLTKNCQKYVELFWTAKPTNWLKAEIINSFKFHSRFRDWWSGVKRKTRSLFVGQMSMFERVFLLDLTQVQCRGEQSEAMAWLHNWPSPHSSRTQKKFDFLWEKGWKKETVFKLFLAINMGGIWGWVWSCKPPL